MPSMLHSNSFVFSKWNLRRPNQHNLPINLSFANASIRKLSKRNARDCESGNRCDNHFCRDCELPTYQGVTIIVQQRLRAKEEEKRRKMQKLGSNENCLDV